MTGSSLPSVKQALVDVLTARAGLLGIPVTTDPPTSGTALQTTTGAYEGVWVGDAVAELSPPHQGTPVVLDERYTLDVVVQVLKAGEGADTQLAADTRAAALLGEVIGALCADPELDIAAAGGVTVLDILPESWEHNTGWLGSGDQHGSSFVLKVGVHARLNLT